jgi:Uma2 family endonuclease
MVATEYTVTMGTAIAYRMTAAEFAALSDDSDLKRELIDGEVCEVASGGPVHETVKGNVALELAAFVKIHKLKVRFQSETRYHLSDEDMFQPDVSLVLGASLDPNNEGKITVVPDLAVEVVSSETAERLNHKIRVLLDSGARAVMAVYPADREIFIHRTNGAERLTGSATLRLEDVLPGFSVPLAAIFDGI